MRLPKQWPGTPKQAAQDMIRHYLQSVWLDFHDSVEDSGAYTPKQTAAIEAQLRKQCNRVLKTLGFDPEY